jgi:hypothetical protein
VFIPVKVHRYVKLSKYSTINAGWERRGKLHAVLISDFDGGKWLASLSGAPDSSRTCVSYPAPKRQVNSTLIDIVVYFTYLKLGSMVRTSYQLNQFSAKPSDTIP